MTHPRPNTAFFKVQITLPDEEQSESTKKALSIKRKIEDLLKREKLEGYEIILESLQKSR